MKKILEILVPLILIVILLACMLNDGDGFTSDENGKPRGCGGFTVGGLYEGFSAGEDGSDKTAKITMVRADWCGFCKKAKPRSIIDLSAITSIYRPGPLSADVDKIYVEAKENPRRIKYDHDIIKKITKETHGFLIFQEQIAMLAHELGDSISLDEGNLLRKLLVKKGTGKGSEQKQSIRKRFMDGATKNGCTKESATKLWAQF